MAKQLMLHEGVDTFQPSAAISSTQTIRGQLVLCNACMGKGNDALTGSTASFALQCSFLLARKHYVLDPVRAFRRSPGTIITLRKQLPQEHGDVASSSLHPLSHRSSMQPLVTPSNTLVRLLLLPTRPQAAALLDQLPDAQGCGTPGAADAARKPHHSTRPPLCMPALLNRLIQAQSAPAKRPCT